MPILNSYDLPYFTTGGFFANNLVPPSSPVPCNICGCQSTDTGQQPCYCKTGFGTSSPSTSCCQCEDGWIASCGNIGTGCGTSTCGSTCLCTLEECNGPNSKWFPCLSSTSNCGSGVPWTEGNITSECCGCCVKLTYDINNNITDCVDTGCSSCDLCTACEVILGTCNPVYCPCLGKWIRSDQECPCCEADPQCKECCCEDNPDCGVWIPLSATCNPANCGKWSCLNCLKNPQDPLCAGCQACNGSWIPITETCNGCTDCPGGCTSQDIANGDCVYCAFTGQYIPVGVLCSPSFVLDCTAFPIFYGCCNKEKLTVCYDFNTSDPIYFSNSSANDVIILEYRYNGGINGSNVNFSYNKIATLCAIPAKDQIAVYFKKSPATEFTKLVYEADSNGVFPYTVNENGEYITWNSAYITNETTSATLGSIGANDYIRIQRETEGRKLLFSFTEGAKLSAADLNLALHQLLFLVQEKEFVSSDYNYYSDSSPIFQLTTGALSLPVKLDFTGALPGRGLIWNGDKLVVGLPSLSLNDLSDVVSTSPSIGDTIIWNGNNWVTSSAYASSAWTISGTSPNEIITFNLDTRFKDWAFYVDNGSFDADTVYNGGSGATNIPIPGTYPNWLGAVRSTIPNLATTYAVAKKNIDYELVTTGTPLKVKLDAIEAAIDALENTTASTKTPVFYNNNNFGVAVTTPQVSGDLRTLSFTINAPWKVGAAFFWITRESQDDAGNYDATPDFLNTFIIAEGTETSGFGVMPVNRGNINGVHVLNTSYSLTGATLSTLAVSLGFSSNTRNSRWQATNGNFTGKFRVMLMPA